jgi:hypothetical protein
VLVADRWHQCLLPDGQVVSVEECRSWLQQSAYEAWQLRVELGWVRGKPGIIASRWRSGEDGSTR